MCQLVFSHYPLFQVLFIVLHLVGGKGFSKADGCTGLPHILVVISTNPRIACILIFTRTTVLWVLLHELFHGILLLCWLHQTLAVIEAHVVWIAIRIIPTDQVLILQLTRQLLELGWLITIIKSCHRCRIESLGALSIFIFEVLGVVHPFFLWVDEISFVLLLCVEYWRGSCHIIILVDLRILLWICGFLTQPKVNLQRMLRRPKHIRIPSCLVGVTRRVHLVVLQTTWKLVRSVMRTRTMHQSWVSIVIRIAINEHLRLFIFLFRRYLLLLISEINDNLNWL